MAAQSLDRSAEELSDDHWLNVNKDTKAEQNINSILILSLCLVT